MLRLLVAGSLTADPMQRVTLKGNVWASFQLRVQTGIDAVLVSCAVFDADAVVEVMRLRKGESVSVTGRAEMRSWIGRDGKEGHGLRCTVDRLMSFRPVKREKAAPATRRQGGPDDGSIAQLPSDMPWHEEAATA